MQAQAEVMAGLQNDCPQLQIESQDPRDFMSRQAERSRLQVTAMTATSASSTRLQVSGVDGNAVLRLAYQLVCQGYSLQKLEVMPDAQNSRFSGLLEVQHES